MLALDERSSAAWYYTTPQKTCITSIPALSVRDAPVDWIAAVRKACLRTPGPCPLDVDVDSIKNCSMGSYAMVERELRLLPADLVPQALAICSDAHVEEAFCVRRELINFKKVQLTMFKAATTLERSLRQLVAFFRQSVYDTASRSIVHSPQHSRLCDVLSASKGVLATLFDCRLMAKTICCVPRHPGSSSPRDAKLTALPHSLRTFRMATLATADKADETDRAKCASSHAHAPDTAKGANSYADVLGPLLRRTRAAHWPSWCVAYFAQVLITRGAAKALLIRHEVQGFCVALCAARAALQRAVEQQGPPADPDAVRAARCTKSFEHETLKLDPRGAKALGEAIRHRDLALMLRTSLDVVADLGGWIEKVAQASTSTERLFLAGDCDSATHTSMCMPPNFMAAQLFRSHAKIVEQLKGDMMEQLKRSGWPPWLCEAKRCSTGPKAMSDRELRCDACQRAFSKLWVHRGVCCECEQDRRSRGFCPFNAACSTLAFCPHDRKCFVCDAWSCDTCRLTRGDSEDVLALAEALQPGHIFLDFDRTLATTRGGGSPLQGKHRADPELLSLFSTFRGCVHVVTRNSYREHIKQFLQYKGVEENNIDVHTVKKGESKAAIVCDARFVRPVLFVDDSIAEHMDPRLRAPAVHRVLFVRGR
eukprot:g855.t1